MKIYKTLILILLFLNIQKSYSQFSASQLYANGLQNFYDAKFDDAINFFTDYIKIETNDIRGYSYRGLSYQAIQNYPGAIEDFSNILSRNIQNAEAYVNRGNTYLLQGNYGPAIEDFTKAIQYDPSYIEGYLGRSRVYVAQRNFDNALRDISLAVGVDPINARVYVNKAWVRLLAGDTSQFFENIKTALYYDSDMVFTNFERDLLFNKIENYKNVLAITNQMIDMNPYGYLGYFARGSVYYLMNKYTEAKDDFNESIKLNKNKDEQFINVVNQLLRSIKRNS